MTSKRLPVAFAASALLFIAAPALAGARVRPAPTRAGSPNCRLTLTAEPHRVTSGDEAPQLFGRLFSCAKAFETSGQAVTIYEVPIGHAARAIGTAATTSAGFYSFIAPAPTFSTAYYASAAGARSAAKTVRVAPQVTLSGPSESKALFTGLSNRVSFTGTVSPADVGARVLLQREAATSYEQWVQIQAGYVGAGGVYSLVHVFSVPGDASLRVVVRAHGLYDVAGASSPLSYAITQRQNPLLTLLAASPSGSGDPILYGQTVTLEGTVAGGANKPVSLQARSRGGLPTTIATQTANASGRYSFQVTPQVNTSYRALSSTGLHSAALFEGVKSTLTANISATSLQDGQTLTFTGTVAPASPSHTIYLERQNTPGAGSFHLVAVGTLNPAQGSGPATYTLTHTVFGTGKQVYRVKVPGDPQNQSEASAPFTVEVSAAPPESLQPGPPAHLPGEETP